MELTVVGLAVEPVDVMMDKDVFLLFHQDSQEHQRHRVVDIGTMAAVVVMVQLELSLSKVDQLLYKRDRLCLHRFQV